MGYFPIVDSQQSDPCYVCTKGPLLGFVVFVHHDGPHAILARNVIGFFSVLNQNRGGKGWNMDEALHRPHPPLYSPFDFADEKRTAADLRAARELLNLAEQRLDEHEEGEHLFDIALKLCSTSTPGDIQALLKHRSSKVRELARLRLAEPSSSPPASATRKFDSSNSREL
jgi:hypothetical protein